MLRKFCFFIMMTCAGSASAQEIKTDSKQPIEITADRLEVLQPTQQAVFSGHVVAVQGGTTLRSDKMTVFYHTSNAKAAPAKGAASPQGALSRIEVDGSVEIITPTESATGDKGSYNVDQAMVTLFGHVILHKEKNLLKGERLEYNMATGRSLLTASGGNVPVTPGVVSTGGRVKGVFVPQQAPAPTPKK